MKVSFLIDGFNLYHSIEDVEKYHGIKSKWLDIKSVLHSYLGAIGREAKFDEIHYFTAIREHIQNEKPNSIERHKRYISVLESRNIQVTYGGFKPKQLKCSECGKQFTAYEEKKTDVAIASKIIEFATKGLVDRIIVVSGDTDLIPAVQLARTINADLKIGFIFPFRRSNDELKKYADFHFTIKPSSYSKFQLPGMVKTKDGDIARPSHW